MAMKKNLILFPLLALLLLVLGWANASLSQETPLMRFCRKHIDPKVPSSNLSAYCDVMMWRRNMTQAECKPLNTFAHTSKETARAICHEPLTRCRNGTLICHESSTSMPVTVCVLKGNARYPNCKYWTNPDVKHIVVSCRGNPLVPVHLDSLV